MVREVKAKIGYFFTDEERSFFAKAMLGENVNKENYSQIPQEEASKIIEENDALGTLSTLDEIDKYGKVAPYISKAVNKVEMTDKQAIQRKRLFPAWEKDIKVIAGERYRHGEDLWKVIQSHTTQEGWEPGVATSSLWGMVTDSEGTLEETIPYKQGMLLEKGKYYTQYEIKYKCIMTITVGYPNDLKDMPTIVEAVQ